MTPDITVTIPQHINSEMKVNDVVRLRNSIIKVINRPQTTDADKSELRQQSPFFLKAKAMKSQDGMGNSPTIIG